MTPNLDYAAEKFTAAVEVLAKSSAPLQQRLHSASMSFMPVKADDFPDDLRTQYQALMERLTADKSDEQRGYIPTTTAKMSDAEAEEVAEMIVELAARIRHRRQG